MPRVTGKGFYITGSLLLLSGTFAIAYWGLGMSIGSLPKVAFSVAQGKPLGVILAAFSLGAVCVGVGAVIDQFNPDTQATLPEYRPLDYPAPEPFNEDNQLTPPRPQFTTEYIDPVSGHRVPVTPHFTQSSIVAPPGYTEVVTSSTDDTARPDRP